MKFTAEDGTILDCGADCVEYETLSTLKTKVETFFNQGSSCTINYDKPEPWTKSINFGWVVHIKEALTEEEEELFFSLLENDSYNEQYDASRDFNLDYPTALLYHSTYNRDGTISEGYVQLPQFITDKMFPKK